MALEKLGGGVRSPSQNPYPGYLIPNSVIFPGGGGMEDFRLKTVTIKLMLPLKVIPS